MCSDAQLRRLVHVVGANLHFHHFAFRPDDSRMQRLIHVELRHRDEVLEATRHRAPLSVDRSQDRVALANAVDKDTDPDQVIDVVEVATAHDHLLIHRVVVLRTAGDRGLNAARFQLGFDIADYFCQVLVAGRCPLPNQTHDLLIHLRIQRGERQVLEFPLDGVYAQSVRQWCINFQSFLGFLLLLFLREPAESAHVVEPVGELDHQHANIAGHRDDHLPHGFRGGGFSVGHLVEFGHAVHQQGDLVPEVFPECIE